MDKEGLPIPEPAPDGDDTKSRKLKVSASRYDKLGMLIDELDSPNLRLDREKQGKLKQYFLEHLSDSEESEFNEDVINALKKDARDEVETELTSLRDKYKD